VSNYSNHIAIIGSGISGLVLGITLMQEEIPCVIFEKYGSISEYGAGISISRNGQKVLEEIGVIDELKSVSGNPKKATFFSLNKKITSIEVDHITTSRKRLHSLLLEKYLSLGGEIRFDFDLNAINSKERLISFSNKQGFHVKHIAACDGIKSTCRDLLLRSDSKPIYSGYSVWRVILETSQDNVNFHLGPNFHIVTYPINNQKTSFVAAIKSKKSTEESWRKKGTFNEFKLEIPNNLIERYPSIKNSNEIFKWGVYTRKNIDQLFFDNITFLGDAAHPIVPFMGQGGCLAIEDGYIFGRLISKSKDNIKESQNAYKNLRLERVKNISAKSINQAKFNHLKNSILVSCRNIIMKNTNIIYNLTKSIWNYDSKKEVDKITL
tara:strand:+ start:3193 stop:4332 length:1140 start_codon:yes stop_codon:yes gene_type:complete